MLRSRWPRLVLVVLVLSAVACGGDDDGNVNGRPDAEPTVPDADPGAPDAEPEQGISCGAEVCDEASQECCVDGAGQTCVATDTCAGTTFGCDGPEDCPEPNEICCGMGEGAHCQAAAECVQAVCHDHDDCPNEGELCCTVGQDTVSRCLAVQVCPGGP
jgi:hypothetical protein